MLHIKEALRLAVADTYNTRNNIERLANSIAWEHRLYTESYFEESMVSCAVIMGTGGDLSTLNNTFIHLCDHLEPLKDMRELEIGYLAEAWSQADTKKNIKNGRFGTKLHTKTDVSVLSRWIRHDSGVGGATKGYDTREDLLKYFQEELTKEEMAFAAKKHIMGQMSIVVEEALKSPVIDSSFVTSKVVQRNKRGDLKWGSVMGAVFWLGLAYKLFHKSEKNEDGTVWSFSAYVDLSRAKLEKELRKCADEQWEVGTYLIDEQARVEELEHRVCQYELLAPMAERLFDWIDLWNVVEEWAYVEGSEFGKIKLNKTPQDKTTEEKARELESILDNMDRYEDTYANAKGRVQKKKADSLFHELQEKAQAADFKRRSVI